MYRQACDHQYKTQWHWPKKGADADVELKRSCWQLPGIHAHLLQLSSCFAATSGAVSDNDSWLAKPLMVQVVVHSLRLLDSPSCTGTQQAKASSFICTIPNYARGGHLQLD